MLVNQALIMTNTRPEYFGRVMSFVVLGFAAQALLAPIWGLSADAIGGRETLIVVALIIAAATTLLTLGWLRVRRLPLEAGTPAAAAAELTRVDGPLVPLPAFVARVAPCRGRVRRSLGRPSALMVIRLCGGGD